MKPSFPFPLAVSSLFGFKGGRTLARVAMDDLEELAALARPPGGELVVADAAFDEDELAIAAVARVRPGRKYEKRSWELMGHARACKKSRNLDRQLAEARAATDAAEARLDVVREVFPMVAQSLGLGAGRRAAAFTEKRAASIAVLAARPAIHGDGPASVAQKRAVSLVARAALQCQAKHVDGLLGPLPPLSPTAGDEVPRPNIVALSWQWDEATQKMRRAMRNLVRGERISQAAVSVQTMMQSGRVKVFAANGPNCEKIASEPIFSRALFLDETKADNLLDGLLQFYPLQLEDPAWLAGVFDGRRLFVFTFSHDRTAANCCILRWIFYQLSGKPGVFLHAEACGLHGVHLVRTRPAIARDLIGAACSFTRYLRNWRAADDWRQMLVKFVELMKVHRSRFSAEQRARNAAIKSILFEFEVVSQTRARASRGKPVTHPSNLEKDVDMLFELVVVDKSALVHPCYVEEGSWAHRRGKVVGRPCCDSREETDEKVTATVLNIFTSRAWAVAAENRWTHLTITLRRLLLGFLLGGMLPQSLDNLKIFWKVPDNLEAQIAALMRAAQEVSFQKTGQLRLLRICKVLGQTGDAGWRLAVLVTGLQPLDHLMYQLFGEANGKKTTLLTLLGCTDPKFATVQSSLLVLLQTFGSQSPKWSAGAAAGIDRKSDRHRKFTRCFLLQLSSALLDHFELKWGEPPYNLIPLLEPGVPVAEKRRRAATLYGKAWHCCSAFLKALRRAFPNPRSLLSRGVPVIQVWCDGARVAIDFSERSHYHLRLDLRSTGKGKNGTVSANRVFVEQLVAEHRERFGVDFRRTVLGGATAAKPEKKASRALQRGTRAFFSRTAKFMLSRKPGRPTDL